MSVSLTAERSHSKDVSATDKRITHLHVTAYPGLLNADMLPAEAREATDFSAIDPLARRRSHKVRDSNAGSTAPADVAATVPMMTEKQMAALLSRMGAEMRQTAGHGKRAALVPLGYRTHGLAPPYDKRSTYRADYREREAAHLMDAADRGHLGRYRDGWTDQEKHDVDVSMKSPFLTFPEALCRNRQTVYRAELIPEAEPADYRAVSHKTNPAELGTTYAYSAYTLGDPRRAVPFDSDLASLKEPRDFLCAAASMTGTSRSGCRSRKEQSELERMRTLRLESMKRSAELRASRKAASQGHNGSGGPPTASCRPDNYIYLPRV